MLFQFYFYRSRFPCAIGSGSVQCRSEEPDSDCLSEFPGENYYSLKILKGNIEPRRYSPGSCAHPRVDGICADSTQNPEAKSRYSLEYQPAAEGLWPSPIYAVLLVLLLFCITRATFRWMSTRTSSVRIFLQLRVECAVE